MKFSLTDGVRSTATPGARGICQGCGAVTIAKCGKHVVWHWAHEAGGQCDRWWESETEWHRNWKNRFPEEWQEAVMLDTKSGERHIADVRTSHGLVIEFQRSTIEPNEVAAREQFYQNMIWIVDGCKNDADRYNFSNMRSKPNENGIASFHWFGRSTLFQRWHRTKPVFFDFGKDHGFWRILRFDPKTKQGLAGVVNIESFVQLASSGTTNFDSVGGPASQ